MPTTTSSFYTVNAIRHRAHEIGLGKRTNTVLQSAFFALANIMPMDEAIEYMKEHGIRSPTSKKGEAIVEMNYKAIDAGVDAHRARSTFPPPGLTRSNAPEG